MRRQRPAEPLRNADDATLMQYRAAALRARARGTSILGPYSLHAIAIEIARRMANATWTNPEKRR